jgi:CRP/FNR family transcriptional regulator, cyclic AMP receptor protein
MKHTKPAIEHLKRVALFSACTNKELEHIDSATTELRFAAGQVLAREGEYGHEFLVIVEGQVTVSIDGRAVATLAPGEFFGEISLLDRGPRTATVTADTEVVAEVIGHREFDAVIADAPPLAKNLLVGLARRLRAADIQLTSPTELVVSPD